MPCPVVAVGATAPMSNPRASSEQAPNTKEMTNHPRFSGIGMGNASVPTTTAAAVATVTTVSCTAR